ncbi:MAG: NADH-quinone oxidoreductase subunit L [Thermoplasmata archaeon]|nr:NADH-quinone oxidoreductase subunit L [Thermoplasmata archaeon]
MEDLLAIWPVVLPLIAAPLAALAYRRSEWLGSSTVIFFAVGIILTTGYLVFLGARDIPLHLDILGLDLIEILDYGLILVFLFIAWRYRNAIVGALASAQLVLLLVLDLYAKPLHLDSTPVAFHLDGLAVMMMFISGVAGGMILIYATEYMKDERGRSRFFLFTFLFLAVMNAAVLSDNLMWLFFFWEMTTLFSFLLINHERTEESLSSAMTALWMTLLGGVFLIGGILWALMEFGTLSLGDIVLQEGIAPLAFIPIVLFAFASFTKSALYPFQKWLVRAMVAPTPVSALLHSATMVNLGLYLLFRLSPLYEQFFLFAIVLSVIGGFAFTFGAVQAIPQDDSKRLLAYSTISNLGLVVVSIGVGTRIAFTAGLLLLFFHAIAKALLFMAVGVVYKKTGSRSFEDMSSLLMRMPIVANMIYIGVFALVALPFGTFITKWILLQSSQSFPVIIPFVVFGTAISVVYYVQWLGRIASEPPRKREALETNYVIPMVVMVIIIFVASLFVIDFTNMFVEPAVVLRGGETPVGYGGVGVNELAGFSTIVPLFVLLIVAVVLPLIFVRSKKPVGVNPYFGGQPCNLSFRGFYFKEQLGEKRLDLPLISMGIFLLFLLLVVVFI